MELQVNGADDPMDVTWITEIAAMSARAQKADTGCCEKYISARRKEWTMVSLIAIGIGVALVFGALATPYQDSWYGRWSRSER